MSSRTSMNAFRQLLQLLPSNRHPSDGSQYQTKPDGPQAAGPSSFLDCEKYVSHDELVKVLACLSRLSKHADRVAVYWTLVNIHHGVEYYTLRVTVASLCASPSEKKLKKPKLAPRPK